MNKIAEDLLLFPFGGNAREALDCIEAINKIAPTYNVVGFIDDSARTSIPSTSYQGIPIGNRELMLKLPCAKVLSVQANPQNFFNRLEIMNSLKINENRFATIIHPRANISSSAKIGKNVLIMAGVTISRDVIIHDHVIILPNTVISHDSVVLEGCCVGSNVSISSNVTVGHHCYIGSGAKIINNIQIAPASLIGLGAVVIKNITEKGHYAGVPAKLL